MYGVERDDGHSGRGGIVEMAPMNTKTYQEPALVSVLVCLVP